MEGQRFAIRADVPGFGQCRFDVGQLFWVQFNQRIIEIDHDTDHFITGHRGRVEGQQIVHVHADDELIRRRFCQRRPAPHRHREREQTRSQ